MMQASGLFCFISKKAGLSLNIQKCEFSQGRRKLLGNNIDAQGVLADPEKTRPFGHDSLE